MHKAHLFNYLGIGSVGGSEFMSTARQQVDDFGAERRQDEEVTDIERADEGFVVETDDGTYDAAYVVLATGANRDLAEELGCAFADDVVDVGVEMETSVEDVYATGAMVRTESGRPPSPSATRCRGTQHPLEGTRRALPRLRRPGRRRTRLRRRRCGVTTMSEESTNPVTPEPPDSPSRRRVLTTSPSGEQRGRHRRVLPRPPRNALVLRQPNLDDPSQTHLFFDTGDGRILTFFVSDDRPQSPRPARRRRRRPPPLFQRRPEEYEDVMESLEQAGHRYNVFDRGSSTRSTRTTTTGS